MAGLIVHEWIAKAGGSEKVVEAMASTFPNADLFCLWNERDSDFSGRTIRESTLAATPLRGHKALSLPFMPLIWRNLRNHRDYEWVLASSHLFAHQAKFPRRSEMPKFVYVHTPARYIWTPELDIRGSNPLARISAPFFRALDHKFAQDQSAIAANSQYIRDRIASTWNRDSVVIYPPVDVDAIQSVDWESRLTASDEAIIDSLPADFVLGASRFVPYKRLDSVISAGEENDLPVVLAGSGPEERRLREIAAKARVPVHFVVHPSDALLFTLYKIALVYIFPPVEDFGIMPVEAMAAGARVVVNRTGGARESVLNGVTGRHTESFVGEEIRQAVQGAASLSRQASRLRAAEFSVGQFQSNLREWVSIDNVGA